MAAVSSHAQPFSIDWHTIDGGGGTSTGGTFSVSGTIGQPDDGGPMTGGNFSLTGGFWSLLDGQPPVTTPVQHEWRGTKSGYWSDPLNWSPATVPGPADRLLFLGNATRRIVTNDLPPRVFGNIALQIDNLEVYGNAIILGSPLGGNTINDLGGAVSNTFHVNIVLAGPVTIYATGNFGVRSLSLLGDISLGSHQLTFVTDGDAICSGVISGSGGVTKSDRGRLVLSGNSANTYSDATIVTDGILELSKSGAVAVPEDLYIGVSGKAAVVYAAPDQISDGAGVFVLRAGELNLANHTDTIRTAELAGGNIITGTGMLTINGDIVCLPADVNGSSISGKLNLGTGVISIDVRADALLDLSAVVSSGPGNLELQKVGPGELRLRSANAYTALTRVSDGTLRVTASDGLGSKDVRLEGGKLVLVNAAINSGKTLVALAPGIIAVEGQSSSWTGPLSLTGIVDIDATASSSLVHSGRIDGSGGFRKTGAGLLRLESAEPNTFQGGANFIQGTLELAKSSAGPTVYAIPGPLTVGDATPTSGRAIVRYVNSNQIADDAQITVERSGRVVMAGWSDSIGSLSGAGEVQLGAAMLTVGGASTPPELLTTFSGVVSGTGSLVKTGGNTLTLTGINTYTGDTVVEQGTLLVHGALAPASLVRVLPGGTLGGNGEVRDVSVASSGRLSPGTSPGSFTANNVQLTAGTLGIELNGNAVGTGYDQLTARGDVTLGGALDVSLRFVPAVGDTFVILRKTSSGAISGTFNGLAEGATFPVNGELFQITYQGGNGNDVVLTRLTGPPAQSIKLIFAPGGSIQIIGTGPPGLTYKLEATTDFTPPIPWTVVATAQADENGAYEFTEINTLLQPMRFYRLISP